MRPAAMSFRAISTVVGAPILLIRRCGTCSFETPHALYRDVDPETFLPLIDGGGL